MLWSSKRIRGALVPLLTQGEERLVLRGASCQSRWAKWFVPYQKGLVCYRSRGGYSQHDSCQRVRDSRGSVCGSEQTKWRIGALKRCATDGRKCQSAPMARIRRCERRGRYLVIATLASIYLGLVRRRLSRGKDPSSLLEALYSQGYSEQVFAAMRPRI